MPGDVGTYLDEMRKRHQRLSRRKMSLEAGLNAGAVQHIVDSRTKGRPETLKALCDRWGTDEDYRELMWLAGHPLPEKEKPSEEEKELFNLWSDLSEEIRAVFIRLMELTPEMSPQKRASLIVRMWKLVEDYQKE